MLKLACRPNTSFLPPAPTTTRYEHHHTHPRVWLLLLPFHYLGVGGDVGKQKENVSCTQDMFWVDGTRGEAKALGFKTSNRCSFQYLEVEGDVGVGMKAKHLRLVLLGQRADVRAVRRVVIEGQRAARVRSRGYKHQGMSSEVSSEGVVAMRLRVKKVHPISMTYCTPHKSIIVKYTIGCENM